MIDRVAVNLENYMSLLTVREKLVASNIANADTPGYRTKDIDFQAEYQKAASGISPTVVESQGLYLKNDGNNVSMDRETRLLSETAMRFSVASNFARAEMRQVRMAIEDGKSA